MKALLRSLTLAATVIALLPALAHAKNFEGKVQMEHRTGKKVMPMTYYVKPGLMRTEMQPEKAGDPPFTGIYRWNEKKMLMLMPAEKQYMEMSFDIEKMAKDVGADDVTFEPTGKREKILGYDCAQYLIKTKKETTEMWATDELGFFFMGGKGGPGGPKASNWEILAREKGMFPLRTIGLDKKGKESWRMEVISIEAKSLSDDLFTAPKGWTKFAMPDLGGLLKNFN